MVIEDMLRQVLEQAKIIRVLPEELRKVRVGKEAVDGSGGIYVDLGVRRSEVLLRGTHSRMEIDKESGVDPMTMMQERLLSSKSSRKQSSTSLMGRRRLERILKLGLKSLRTSLIYNNSLRSQKQQL